MPHLFGCTCNQPERLAEALLPVRDALVVPAPVYRWGVGYIQGGEVLLSRTPRLSEKPVDFFDALSQLKSDYLVGQTGENDGLRNNENTGPFRFRRWLFGQEGTIGNYEAVAASLVEHVPGFMRRNMKGKTAAELVFHVFLSVLHDQGNIDDPNLPLRQTQQALRAALALTLDHITKNGGGDLPGNLVATNGRSMIALRTKKPLWVRHLTVSGPNGERDERFRGVLIVSADNTPGQGFEELPVRSMVSISRELRTDILSLDE